MYVYAYAYGCSTGSMEKLEDNFLEIFSFFTTWVLGTELRPSGLVMSAFTPLFLYCTGPFVFIPFLLLAIVCVQVHVEAMVGIWIFFGFCFVCLFFPVTLQLFIEAESLAEPGAHQFYLVWLASLPWGSFVSVPYCWDYRKSPSFHSSHHA